MQGQDMQPFFDFNWNGRITETNLSFWESLIKQLSVSG